MFETSSMLDEALIRYEHFRSQGLSNEVATEEPAR